MNYIFVIILVLLSGLFSGLTLGLLSLDKNELERKISLGDKQAKKVYKVRKRGNLLLCTLLISNVAVNASIAIILNSLAAGFVAGLIATGLIVIFGEIIPQATCARYALAVGAKTAWLVKIFMFVLFPVCWPIAWVLDRVLGEEMPTVYSKHELMKIVEEHEGTKESEIDADEERIIKGALSYSDKTAGQVMTPRTVVYALENEEILDKNLLDKIRKKGFTRVPVYKNEIDNIVGILYTKDLINIKPGVKVNNACRKNKLLFVVDNKKLDELLNIFIESRAHMAFVKDEFEVLLGIVALEDVIEEVFKIEIVDESDTIVDMQKFAKDKLNKRTRKKES